MVERTERRSVMVERSLVRLQDVAERADLGYRPNPHARAPALSASTDVGLVVHDIRAPTSRPSAEE